MIYAIQSNSYVKIGFCLRDPIRRLEKLQIGNPVTLKLIALIDGDEAVERRWHSDWDAQRVRGEWFKLTPDLKEALRPHWVSHKKLSRNRPARTIEGYPAHLVIAGWRKMGLLSAQTPDELMELLS